MVRKEQSDRKTIGLKTKRTRRITTVEDILARDDVNEILGELNKVKPDISDLIVIYYDKENNRWNFKITGDTLSSTLIWMLEVTKNDILNYDSEE